MASSSRMKKPCDHCKRYLDHPDEKNQSMSCFLRRMTASPKHIMIVPNKFLKHFVGKLSQTIKLESPNGSVYNVEVTECYNKKVLRHGWEEFVGAHHIEENDFLLFRHIENSVFKVLIFDSDGCEKIIRCDCIKSIPSVGETRVDYVDISSSSQFDTIGSSGKLSSRHGETLKITVTSSSSGGSEDIPSENESFESDDLQAPGADYIVSHRTYLSQEQKERVTLLIQEIQPKTTVYIAVMRKSHVHPPAPSVDIIKEYAFAYFPHVNANVTLQRPGKSKKWHPKFNTTKGGVYRLQGQWLDFVRDNHVQEGDICAFLPEKLGRRFTFTVYVLCATATRSRSETGFQRAGPCPGGESSPKMASEVHTKEPTDGEHVSSERDMNGILHESLESKDSRRPCHPLYFLPSNSGLSKSQKKIVEERVQAIKSEVPIYVAIMRRVSLGISYKPILELGSRYATAVNLPAGGQTVVLWCRRNIWKANIVTTRQRHYLCGGWHKFVRDNDLGFGDICLFELKRNERELTMMVHIIPRKEI
ncbi:B3 domain-containing protein Os03g0619600-like isoform X2 [Miscanthus floridulus]|uniref:B3 domain-containing protein Os03g0619600-like isoform X2 n=1 Tax=Miscanthus floridulus TaxID=154761 RepID=UPI00345ABD90